MGASPRGNYCRPLGRRLSPSLPCLLLRRGSGQLCGGHDEADGLRHRRRGRLCLGCKRGLDLGYCLGQRRLRDACAATRALRFRSLGLPGLFRFPARGPLLHRFVMAAIDLGLRLCLAASTRRRVSLVTAIMRGGRRGSIVARAECRFRNGFHIPSA